MAMCSQQGKKLLKRLYAHNKHLREKIKKIRKILSKNSKITKISRHNRPTSSRYGWKIITIIN